MDHVTPKRIAAGIATTAASFVLLGTIAALWDNPVFVRMTPAGGWEIAILAAMSVAAGVYVAIRRPFCSVKGAGAGGILAFLGVACPVCNKILLLVFGGELLLAWFEPLRIYLAAAGTLLVGGFALRELHMIRRRAPAGSAK
ncbi:MAG: hypothetical protein JSU82_03375 [Rhodospirillales bacterium]|nr:MAG: hypothetical protein JSU82_03375 [Rhodospirillales bacterium]